MAIVELMDRPQPGAEQAEDASAKAATSKEGARRGARKEEEAAKAA
jgi:hypothetical protein